MSRSTKLEEILLRAGVLDEEGLKRVDEVRQRDGGSVGRIASDLGLGDEEAICRAIAAGLGLESPALESLSPAPELIDCLPADLCRKRLVVPIGLQGRSVRLAMVDPLDYSVIQDVEFRCGKRVVTCVAS